MAQFSTRFKEFGAPAPRSSGGCAPSMGLCCIAAALNRCPQGPLGIVSPGWLTWVSGLLYMLVAHPLRSGERASSDALSGRGGWREGDTPNIVSQREAVGAKEICQTCSPDALLPDGPGANCKMAPALRERRPSEQISGVGIQPVLLEIGRSTSLESAQGTSFRAFGVAIL